ncbi:VOC family protein [Bacillus paramycoides]|uniref:VOC family protein n=1 Tax=Bacillus paramycoides TaxID=2026194 RepID=UPI003CFFCB3A
MIKRLYAISIYVLNLGESMYFYQNILDLKLAHYEGEKRSCYYWIGENKEALLEICERRNNKLTQGDFSFEVPFNKVSEVTDWLHKNEIEVFNTSQGKWETKVRTSSWLPITSIFIKDPDGNNIELVAILPKDP